MVVQQVCSGQQWCRVVPIGFPPLTLVLPLNPFTPWVPIRLSTEHS